MDTRRIERKFAISARLLTFFAVFASTVGAVLMILIGLEETALAVWAQFAPPAGDLPAGDISAINLISALDRFLMAIVLLYFAFGIYVLFVRPDEPTEDLGIPAWLRVGGIGELKQTLAEVIIVVLFVLFLRVALETFISAGPELSWQAALKLLTLPLAIVLLSAALRLAELHPKSRPTMLPPSRQPSDWPDRANDP